MEIFGSFELRHRAPFISTPDDTWTTQLFGNRHADRRGRVQSLTKRRESTSFAAASNAEDLHDLQDCSILGSSNGKAAPISRRRRVRLGEATRMLPYDETIVRGASRQRQQGAAGDVPGELAFEWYSASVLARSSNGLRFVGLRLARWGSTRFFFGVLRASGLHSRRWVSKPPCFLSHLPSPIAVRPRTRTGAPFVTGRRCSGFAAHCVKLLAYDLSAAPPTVPPVAPPVASSVLWTGQRGWTDPNVDGQTATRMDRLQHEWNGPPHTVVVVLVPPTIPALFGAGQPAGCLFSLVIIGCCMRICGQPFERQTASAPPAVSLSFILFFFSGLVFNFGGF